MSSRITCNPATAHGKMLAELCDELIEARSKAVRLKRAVESMVLDTGDGATWDQLEAELGVPAGLGQTVYNLIAGATTAIQATDILLLTDRMEQG
jgi:hypothetical protein